MELLREYGVATHVYIPIPKRAVVDFAVGADWTPAAGDVKISKDGGAAANVTNLPTAITMGNTAMWDFSITATEMQAAQINVTIADSATKAVEDQSFMVSTYGNASARHKVNLNDSVRAGLTALPNAAAGANGGLPLGDANARVDLSKVNGSAVNNLIAGRVDANAQVVGDKTGFSLSAAGILAIWDQATSLLTTAGSIGKLLVDNVNATISSVFSRLGAPAGASVSADIAAVKVDTAAIKAKTDNLPSDPADESLLEAKLDAIIAYIDTEVGLLISELTGARAELGAVPAANATLGQKVDWLFMSSRNKRTTTSTQDKVLADDASTVVGTAALSDDGTTFAKGEYA